MSMNLDEARRRWFPVAASTDLHPHHVFYGQLLGRELALWRADDGHVNVWENRCLHRGVRLTLGINDGRELTCRYHGWRYASGSAGCTYIPAHPADAPARTICNRTFPAVERWGMIWSAESPETDLTADLVADMAARDDVPDESADVLLCRALPVDAALPVVQEALTSLSSPVDGTRHWLQPVDANRTIVRGVVVLNATAASGHILDSNARLGLLKAHNRWLSALRDRIEAQHPASAKTLEWPVHYAPLSESLSREPAVAGSGRQAPWRLVVDRIVDTADGIKAFELVPRDGSLPTCQPGAHIDLHLGNGLVRQYSLVNAPGQSDRYVIGVQCDTNSSGGGRYLHEVVKCGDVLAASAPRHHFPLRRDAVHTVLIAGGIGVTPLLSMAQALAHGKLSFELHYFARSDAHLAFSPILSVLGDTVTRHVGCTAEQSAERLNTLLENPGADVHVYVCGPAGLIETVRTAAASAGWHEAAVHFEYFANDTPVDDSSTFEVALARSDLTFTVQPGSSLLSQLRAHGVDLPSSCEQGACGTCKVKVLEGEPAHQDVYLSDEEKRAGQSLMTCVSRARSARLVLDI